MSRPTLVYIIMLAVCAGGVYAIMRVGANLHATPDLTGTWEVADAAKAAADAAGPTLSVEQSGRFVQIQFSDGLHLDLKAASPTPPDGEGTRTVYLAGGEWTFVARFIDGDLSRAFFRLNGPREATFSARRRSNGRPERRNAGAGNFGFSIADFGLKKEPQLPFSHSISLIQNPQFPT